MFLGRGRWLRKWRGVPVLPLIRRMQQLSLCCSRMDPWIHNFAKLLRGLLRRRPLKYIHFRTTCRILQHFIGAPVDSLRCPFRLILKPFAKWRRQLMSFKLMWLRGLLLRRPVTIFTANRLRYYYILRRSTRRFRPRMLHELRRIIVVWATMTIWHWPILLDFLLPQNNILAQNLKGGFVGRSAGRRIRRFWLCFEDGWWHDCACCVFGALAWLVVGEFAVFCVFYCVIKPSLILWNNLSLLAIFKKLVCE